MPAPRTDIDRDGIAASVALHGIRATARMTGEPVGTVQDIARAARVTMPTSAVRTVTQRVTAVRTPTEIGSIQSIRPAHQVITNALAELGKASALAIARRGHLVLESAAERATADPERAMAESGDVLATAKGLQVANVPGFEREQTGGPAVQVNIGIASMLPAPED